MSNAITIIMPPEMVVEIKTLALKTEKSISQILREGFEIYKKKLSKEEKLFFSPWARHFESLNGNKRFYVLHKRLQG